MDVSARGLLIAETMIKGRCPRGQPVKGRYGVFG